MVLAHHWLDCRCKRRACAVEDLRISGCAPCNSMIIITIKRVGSAPFQIIHEEVHSSMDKERMLPFSPRKSINLSLNIKGRFIKPEVISHERFTVVISLLNMSCVLENYIFSFNLGCNL